MGLVGVQAVVYEAGTGWGWGLSGPIGVTGMGPAWGPGCGFIADFLVAVRGGWFGMTILLCPVTGVETGGDAVALAEP